MRKFLYKIVSPQNKLEQGRVLALSPQLAKRKLRANGSTVISIQRYKRSLLKRELNFGSGFTATDKINFFKDMAVIVESGVSMVEALRILKEQVRGSGIKKAMDHIIGEVENGQQLSAAMKKYPKYFPPYITESIHTGEVSGRLTDSLQKIAHDLQKDYDLRRKVVAAVSYPALVALLMIAVAVTLVVYVLPRVAELFAELQGELPLFTRVLLSIGEFFSTFPWIAPSLLIVSVITFFAMLKNKKGRYIIHSLVLKIPVFKHLAKEYNLVIFFRSLESLVSAGVSFVHAMEVAERTLKNDVYRRTISSTRPALLHGLRLAEVLEPYPELFPKRIQKIIKVGEETGNLETTFARITKYYEDSIDHKTKMLTVMLEPVLMLVIGLVVGGLALSVFLPLYRAASLF